MASSSGCGMSSLACSLAASIPCLCSAALREIDEIKSAKLMITVAFGWFIFMFEINFKAINKIKP